MENYYGAAGLTNVKDLAANINLTIYPEDKIEAFPDPALGIGSQLKITRATAVNVVDAKKLTTYHTWSTTVSQLLKEKNIELLGQDSASPNIDSALSYNMNVTITRVAEVEVVQSEPIAYTTSKKNSVDLEKGQTQIQTKGVNGVKQVTYKVKRVDGVEVSRTVVDSQITVQPVTEVQIIGIGPRLAKSGPYVDIINSAAKKYLINGTALMCLMMKESNGHATSGYPDGPYQGLFQYDPSYWVQASSQAGYGGASITDPSAQIFTTAYQLTHGQSRRWPPWGGCSSQ